MKIKKNEQLNSALLEENYEQMLSAFKIFYEFPLYKVAPADLLIH